MRSAARRSLAVAAFVLAASAGIAQIPAAPPRLGAPAAETPVEVAGYIATVQVEAIADLKPTGTTAPEAQTMLGRLKAPTSVVSTLLPGPGPVAAGDRQHRLRPSRGHRAAASRGRQGLRRRGPADQDLRGHGRGNAAGRAGRRSRDREQPVRGEGPAHRRPQDDRRRDRPQEHRDRELRDLHTAGERPHPRPAEQRRRDLAHLRSFLGRGDGSLLLQVPEGQDRRGAPDAARKTSASRWR